MKKLLILFASLSVLLLAACGETSTEEVESKVKKEAETEKAEAEKKKEEVAEEVEEKAEEETTDVEEVKQNIADDDIVKIDLISVERKTDDIFGDSIKVNFEIENKTDNTIVVQSENVSVDGYMVDDLVAFSPEIAGNKKTKDYLSLESAFLDDGEELPKLEENLEMKIIVIDEEQFDRIAEYDVNIDFK